MRLNSGTGLVLAGAALIVALSIVAWRQAQAMEVLALVDGLERDLTLTRAEQVELERRIQALTSRSYVVPTARTRLGMRLPSAEEQVLIEVVGP
jgi:cell division protein FtsL